MSRRLRRFPAVLLPLVLLTGLAACGDDGGDGEGSAADPLSTVSIEGAPGKAPEVTWDGEM